MKNIFKVLKKLYIQLLNLSIENNHFSDEDNLAYI